MSRFTALRRILVRSRPHRPLLAVRHASSLFRMPAMSPTMTEGGIASWKLAQGDTFAAGDVLLEIETDKATIDVEAQDDGVLGKILVNAGENKVPVGQVIAILAEEGDDLAALEVPGDLGPEGSTSAAPSESKPEHKEPAATAKATTKTEPNTNTVEPAHPKITHNKPLFPSVLRLLTSSPLSAAEISNLKGTGRNGMLTKGDVLFALGKITDARGSAGKMSPTVLGVPGAKHDEAKPTQTAKKPAPQPMDGIAWRRAILVGLSSATKPVLPLSSSTAPITAFETQAHEFDELLEPYASLFQAPPQPHVQLPTIDLLAESKEYAHAHMGGGGASAAVGPVKDEWEGLF